MAETQSKIIISAEDRTRAAFAAIERNTSKTAAVLGRFQGTMLQLAGAGTLVNFFRTNAEHTEKWRDEMARLDATTKKFFENAAAAGQLDPMINAVKGGRVALLSFGVALEIVGKHLGAMTAFWVSLGKGEFREAWQILKLDISDIGDGLKKIGKISEDVFTDAPKGYAKQVEEQAARIKEAARKMKEAEEERRKAALAAGKPAEDAFRAEVGLGEGQTAAGLTALGEAAVNERMEKERELLQRESELRAQQREQDIQALLESQLTEKELADAQYAQDLQSLYDARQAEYLTELQFKQSIEQLELTHRAKLGDIRAQAELRAMAITKQSYRQQTQAVLGELVTMTAGVSRYSKFLFQVNKAAAFANTALKVPEAVASSFAFGARLGGPVLGAAMGAIAFAAQMAQLRAIAGTSFEGAAGAAGVPSLAGTPGVPVTPVESVAETLPVTPARATREFNVTLVGSQFSAAQIRDELIPLFEEAIGDGVRFNVRTT